MLTAQNLLAEGTKDMEKASNSKECTENFGISLGKGLPPIPRKLADRILRGEFIDMQELLPESWQVADQELEGPENRARGSRRRVLDIKVWVQCFACYMGVIATGRPQRIPELLVYLVQIVRVNQEFEGSDWAVYDETFHRQAAVSGNQQWSKLNPSLFSLCFTGKGRRTGRCRWCLGTTHTTEACPVVLEEEGQSLERNPAGRVGRMGTQNNTGLRRPWPICRNFNHGRCGDRFCRYCHVCLDCNGSHPRIVCTSQLSSSHPTQGSGPKQSRYYSY